MEMARVWFITARAQSPAFLRGNHMKQPNPGRIPPWTSRLIVPQPQLLSSVHLPMTSSSTEKSFLTANRQTLIVLRTHCRLSRLRQIPNSCNVMCIMEQQQQGVLTGCVKSCVLDWKCLVQGRVLLCVFCNAVQCAEWYILWQCTDTVKQELCVYMNS